MRKIDGEELDGILLREYEKHMKKCQADLEVGALMMAECELHRAQGLRKALDLTKGMPTIK